MATAYGATVVLSEILGKLSNLPIVTIQLENNQIVIVQFEGWIE